MNRRDSWVSMIGVLDRFLSHLALVVFAVDVVVVVINAGTAVVPVVVIISLVGEFEWS